MSGWEIVRSGALGNSSSRSWYGYGVNNGYVYSIAKDKVTKIGLSNCKELHLLSPYSSDTSLAIAVCEG